LTGIVFLPVTLAFGRRLTRSLASGLWDMMQRWLTPFTEAFDETT
jgi:hypothetical protein